MCGKAVVAGLIGLVTALPAQADESPAKAAQNLVADLVSLPGQHDADLQFGPDDDYLSVTNIQPVLPFRLNDDYNPITRTILPIVSVPGIAPGDSRDTGIGDTSSPIMTANWEAEK